MNASKNISCRLFIHFSLASLVLEIRLFLSREARDRNVDMYITTIHRQQETKVDQIVLLHEHVRVS